MKEEDKESTKPNFYDLDVEKPPASKDTHISGDVRLEKDSIDTGRHVSLQDLDALTKSTNRLKDNLLEPFSQVTSSYTSIVDSIIPAQESLRDVIADIANANSLSVSFGRAFTESQERILNQLSGALATSYVPLDFSAPKILNQKLNNIELPFESVSKVFDENNYAKFKLESFQPIQNDYSVLTSLSTITTQEPFVYERLDSIEMKVEAVQNEQSQANAKTHSEIRTLRQTVERQGEMLAELSEYVKKHQTNTFSLKDIRYNSQVTRLHIDGEATSINGQKQDALCRILFDSKRKISEPIPMDVLVEHFAGTDAFSMTNDYRKKVIRTICDAGYNLNAKIAKSTKVKTLLIISNKRIFINPNLFE